MNENQSFVYVHNRVIKYVRAWENISESPLGFIAFDHVPTVFDHLIIY